MNATYHEWPNRLLPLSEARTRMGVGRTKFFELLKTPGAAPRPVKMGRLNFFLEKEVEQWIADRLAERDGRVSPTRLLLTEKEAADILQVSVSWLQKDRLKDAPSIPFQRVGALVRYELNALKGKQ